MSHVYAARAAVPVMVQGGGGYLLNTASAAGLLTQLGSLQYAVTKAAAVSLGEFLSITYGDKGIVVSMLCPQAVETNILANSPDRTGNGDGERGTPGAAAGDGVLQPSELAQTVIDAMARRTLLGAAASRGADLPRAQSVGHRPVAVGHAALPVTPVR